MHKINMHEAEDKWLDAADEVNYCVMSVIVKSGAINDVSLVCSAFSLYHNEINLPQYTVPIPALTQKRHSPILGIFADEYSSTSLIRMHDPLCEALIGVGRAVIIS